MNKTDRQAAKQAHTNRMLELHTAAQRTVATGRCPQCSSPLISNLALAGWYQCAGYAALSHRRPEHIGLAKCDYQTFTE